jgi:hypothetical protein
MVRSLRRFSTLSCQVTVESAPNLPKNPECGTAAIRQRAGDHFVERGVIEQINPRNVPALIANTAANGESLQSTVGKPIAGPRIELVFPIPVALLFGKPDFRKLLVRIGNAICNAAVLNHVRGIHIG